GGDSESRNWRTDRGSQRPVHVAGNPAAATDALREDTVRSNAEGFDRGAAVLIDGGGSAFSRRAPFATQPRGAGRAGHRISTEAAATADALGEDAAPNA